MASMESRVALMEQIAMYFAALPCPPMPILAARESDGRLEPTNSHDLLAALLIQAMHVNNKELNEKRKKFQVRPQTGCRTSVA